jgi:hypothetical protein
MGTLTFPVFDLSIGDVVHAWIRLASLSGCRRPGEIRLRLHLTPSGGEPWTPAPYPATKLLVTVIRPKDLAKMDTFGKCDLYVLLWRTKSKQTKKTTLQKKTLTLESNQKFEFVLNHRSSMSFIFKCGTKIGSAMTKWLCSIFPS